MRKYKPWYWVARGGWYANVDGRRVKLLAGPKDAATEEAAWGEYRRRTTPPEFRPEVIEERVREAVRCCREEMGREVVDLLAKAEERGEQEILKAHKFG